MFRHTLTCIAASCVLSAAAQKTDTLVIHYASDQHQLTRQYQIQLDSFLQQQWDRIAIYGFTDETDEEDYNMNLSEKRARSVYDQLVNRRFPASYIHFNFMGEKYPVTTNATEEGRALNRRTEIIGYRYPRIKPKPVTDPLQPITSSLDNGFIITYKPGRLPWNVAMNFASGSSSNFQLITNTYEMRRNNVWNNTTNGEILSSVIIFCGSKMVPCKLDTPVLVKVPIPFETTCPIEKVKFFNTVVERGKRIWQEQSKELYPEVINGKKYIGVWIDDFCECINFDFKVDPDCYPVDSMQVYMVNTRVKNLTVELKGLNSVYLPRRINDSVYSVVYLKDREKDAVMQFTLYDGRKRIRAFGSQPLTQFVQKDKKLMLTTDTVKLLFRKLDVADAFIRVNRDKYRVSPYENFYEFIYLNKANETVLVDFTLVDKKGNLHSFRNQPVECLPYDADKGCIVIDKDFLKRWKQLHQAVALR